EYRQIQDVSFLVDLEGIRESDIAERDVLRDRLAVTLGGFLAQGVIGRLNVHSRDVVRQQHDLRGEELTGVLPGKVFRFDKARLQETDGERGSPSERVEDAHAFVGKPLTKVLLG